MKTLMHIVLGFLCAVPIIHWIEPPTSAGVAIGALVSMVVGTWLSSWMD